ncbi:hypothetical protein DER46DRAFT_581197 [Fusarium sp. MPI-SDFR-AT-0072]|nr:hypothetical protein DER46DRAFT_581197 [Fusarium sp. MPI-SDFR-AT-0072]
MDGMGCDGWLAAGCWLGWVQCGRSPSWRWTRWTELGLVAQVLSCSVLVRIEKSNNGHARLSEYRTVVSYRTVKRDEGAGGWIGQTVEAQAKARGWIWAVRSSKTRSGKVSVDDGCHRKKRGQESRRLISPQLDCNKPTCLSEI